MKSLLISQLVAMFASSMPIGVDTRHEAERLATDSMLKGRNPRRLSDVTEDPYFGIKTAKRRNAHNALTSQDEAFQQTRVGKRNARGRGLTNPFTLKPRRDAFDAAIARGETRKDAWRLARRVAP